MPPLKWLAGILVASVVTATAYVVLLGTQDEKAPSLDASGASTSEPHVTSDADTSGNQVNEPATNPPTRLTPGTFTEVDSLDAWLQSIPADKRHIASAFAQRYPDAYRFTSKEQQAWMLQHGFPTLEDVVAFQESPTPCPLENCTNSKLASLHADLAIGELSQRLASLGIMGSDSLDLSGTPEAARTEVLRDMSRANDYIRRARDNGSVLFAAYLSERLARTKGDQIAATDARAFLAACGDQRILDADSVVVGIMRRALNQVEGGRRVCGYRPGRPVFPSDPG